MQYLHIYVQILLLEMCKKYTQISSRAKRFSNFTYADCLGHPLVILVSPPFRKKVSFHSCNFRVIPSASTCTPPLRSFSMTSKEATPQQIGATLRSSIECLCTWKMFALKQGNSMPPPSSTAPFLKCLMSDLWQATPWYMCPLSSMADAWDSNALLPSTFCILSLVLL